MNNTNQIDIIKTYIDQYSIVRHQIEGYNDLIHNLIPQIINSSEPIIIEKENTIWEYKFANPIFHPCLTNGSNGNRVLITPNECRIKDMSYCSDLQVDIITTEIDKITKKSTSTTTSVILVKFPILVKSDLCVLRNKNKEQLIEYYECSNDTGGYFILKGGEKVIVSQEKMANNYPFVLEGKNDILNVEIRSLYEGEVRSLSKCELRYYQYSKKNTVIIDKTFRVLFGKLTKDIPLVILMRALGFTDINEIISLCYPQETNIDDINATKDLLESTVDESFFIVTKESAILFIAKSLGITNFENIEKVFETVYKALDEELLPHEGIDESKRLNKARFLGYMTQKCILVIKKKRLLDDRDHYGNKRVDTVGYLLANIFRMSFSKFCRTLKTDLEKKTLNNKSIQLEYDLNYTKVSITNDLNYCLGTGNWSVNRQKITKTGVSQVLPRLSYIAAISTLRRVNTPSSKNSKSAKPRQLHTTSWGYVDPHETPEGQQCGFVKNMSMLCNFSSFVRADIIIAICDENSITNIYTKEYKVFVNGIYIGTTNIPMEIYDLFKEYKLQGIPSYDVSIAYNKIDKELRIVTDSGRYSRPVFIVKNNKLVCNIDMIEKSKSDISPFLYLLKNKAIEYIDPLESENVLIAMNISSIGNDSKKYTHAEIHPTVFMGAVTNCTPFLNHNPSPRVSFGGGMFKQSLGLYATNFKHRTDTSAHMLYYPEKAVVRSHYVDLMSLGEQPAGQVAIVAILCYGGFNQEDSLIANKTSIERGMFNGTYFKTYKDSETNKQGIYTETIGPDTSSDINKDMTMCNLDKITGIVLEGTKCKPDQVLVTKTMIVNQPNGKFIKKNKNLMASSSDNSIVDKVYTYTKEDGGKAVKVRIRQPRIPEVGDKFASLSAQKGTLGQILDQSEMPFTQSGITVDLILNPHALPNRMTISQLIECLTGKKICVEGISSDPNATAFENRNIEDIGDTLVKAGYNRYGYERMINGITGEMMDGLVFIGPTYYQKLNHMVQDKFNVRGKGQTQNLNRQPVEGRKREGGGRVGEMENSVFVTHGVSSIVKERLMDVSDKFKTNVCDQCGLIMRTKDNSCGRCKTSNLISTVIPYAFKLLTEELMVFNIASRIKFK